MVDYKVEEYHVGAIGTNCYFLINNETKEMLVIDPGGNGEMLIAKIEEAGLKPVAILLTHGHFDHVMAAGELASRYGIKRYIHEADRDTLGDPRMNVSPMLGESLVFEADCFFKDQDVLELAGFQLKVLFTPGHTPGGACFYAEEEKIVFTGDSLFCESIGRTDFPGGSASKLVHSVQDKLMTLSDDVKVYPGHEGLTSIGRERMYNPYL